MNNQEPNPSRRRLLGRLSAAAVGGGALAATGIVGGGRAAADSGGALIMGIVENHSEDETHLGVDGHSKGLSVRTWDGGGPDLPPGFAVWGDGHDGSTGVLGTVPDVGYGVSGSAGRGFGVLGVANHANGVGTAGEGAQGGTGVRGRVPDAGFGVLGRAGVGFGVRGEVTDVDGIGVSGSGPNVGVQGEGKTGVLGSVHQVRPASRARHPAPVGALGVTATGHGVHGDAGSGGVGVFGRAAPNGHGVCGQSDAGFGVIGWATTGVGVSGESSTNGWAPGQRDQRRLGCAGHLRHVVRRPRRLDRRHRRAWRVADRHRRLRPVGQPHRRDRLRRHLRCGGPARPRWYGAERHLQRRRRRRPRDQPPHRVRCPRRVVGFGVRGDAVTGIGVSGSCPQGIAVSGEGRFGGQFKGTARRRTTVPTASVGARRPASTSAGEMVWDNNGDFWVCKADGTPGTWVKLA